MNMVKRGGKNLSFVAFVWTLQSHNVAVQSSMQCHKDFLFEHKKGKSRMYIRFWSASITQWTSGVLASIKCIVNKVNIFFHFFYWKWIHFLKTILDTLCLNGCKSTSNDDFSIAVRFNKLFYRKIKS